MSECPVCYSSSPWDNERCEVCGVPLLLENDLDVVKRHKLLVARMLVLRRIEARFREMEEPKILRGQGVPQLSWDWSVIGAVAGLWSQIFRPFRSSSGAGAPISSEN